MKRILAFVLSFLFVIGSNAQCPGAALTISNSPSPATCPSNGVITVTAGGGIAPYEYRITAGPLTRPYQSSNIFASLLPGTYTVQLRDACGSTITANSTVVNSYTAMTLSRTFTNPTCNAPGNGIITTTVAGGSLPLSYRLLQGATVIAGPQASNVFNNLPSGDYTTQVTDACGEIRTIATTLTYTNITISTVNVSDNNWVFNGGSTGTSPEPYYSASNTVLVSGAGPIMYTCDSVAIRLHSFLSNATAPRRAWVKELSTGTIIYDETYTPPALAPTIYIKIGVNYRFYFSDLCDNVDSTDRNYATQTTYSINALATKLCASNRLSLNWLNDYNTKNRYSAPVDTITIISSTLPGDPLVGSQIIHKKVYTGGSLTGLYFDGVTVGQTYTIQVKNFCGTYNVTQLISAPSPINSSNAPTYSGCKLNTATIVFGINGAFPIDATKLYCRINSGPVSFTDNYGVTYAITYPIYDSSTVINQISLGGLPVGSYSVDFWFNCGVDTLRKTFDVTSTQLHTLTSSLTVVQGCSGNSTVTLNTSFKQYTDVIINLYKKNVGGVYTLQSSSPLYQLNTIPANYTFTGLLDGDYLVVVRPTPTKNQLFPMVCDTFFREYFTLQYQVPAFTSASKGFVCTSGGSDGKVELHTANGIAPFTFERLAIPANTVITSQTDSAFTGLSAGTYRFRVRDFCGNAVIQDFSIDTLVANPIQILNPGGCIGQEVKLFATKIYPGATFSWTGPSGFTSIADTVVFNPFTAANAGTYTLTQTIPGCATSVTTSATLSTACLLPIKLSAFTASATNCNVLISWKSEVEISFSKYEVLYSKDGITYSTTATIAGKGDNSTYNYTNTTIKGKAFFKLKMVDINGAIRYSNTLMVNNTCNADAITIYPNPAKDFINVNLTGYGANTEAALYNSKGQLVQIKLLINGNNKLNTAALPPGVYSLMLINANGEKVNHKVIVQR